MNHPLHKAVAERIAAEIHQGFELLRDPACGGAQHLPLFIGTHKSRDTRMCCADLLLVCGGHVQCIVEIEESGFLPTKICGKFFQAGLANHFIHDAQGKAPVPYVKNVLFVQVLDASACLKTGGRKKQQAELIESEICKILPVRGIAEYRLIFVNGPEDGSGLDMVSAIVNANADQALAAGRANARR